MKLITRAGIAEYNFKLHLRRRDTFNATWQSAAPRTYQLFIDAFAFEKRCEEFFQHICFSPVPRRAAPRRLCVQPVEITSGQSSGATTILMIILYRELLPGRNKRTLDYRRASKRVTARRVVLVPVVFVTRVCCAKMKIARANSLERLLIMVSSDTRERIGREKGITGRREDDSCLSRGVEEPEERCGPRFLQLVPFPAHAIRHRRVNCRTSVRQINKPEGLRM